MNNIFGENLRKLRAENNLSQIEMASILGISQVTLHNWEFGKTDIDGKNLFNLSKTFKISSDELLGVVDLPPVDENINDLIVLMNNLNCEEQKNCLLAVQTFLECRKKLGL